MRAVVQRVSRARVSVEGVEKGAIGPGLLVLLGCGHSDGEEEMKYVADKLVHLRIFPDREGRMNRSLLEVGGSMLVVSQFTLYADTRKGRRPSFVDAMKPEQAQALYQRFCAYLRSLDVEVQEGVFGAHMEVELLNDGPVTILVESPATGSRIS